MHTYLDCFEKFRVIAEVFHDPGENTSGGVLRRKEHTDDIVGDLIVGEVFAFLILRFHETSQEITLLHRFRRPPPPLEHDLAQKIV